MAVRVLTQDTTLNRDNDDQSIVSATSQEGEYIGNASPDLDNTGSLWPVTSGALVDISESGTTTSDGAVTGETFIDSGLNVYGDNFFIGATATVGGESRTVTDFVQSTGTIYVSPVFSAQVTSATAYSITYAKEDLDYIIEMTVSGTAGTAAFKVSHDGGSNYLGLSSPDTTNWPAEAISHTYFSVPSTAAHQSMCMLEYDGNLWLLSSKSADGGIFKIEFDGSSWETLASVSDATLISASDFNVYITLSAIVIPSGLYAGRICVYGFTYPTEPNVIYSDDGGDTWTEAGLDIAAFEPSVLGKPAFMSDGQVWLPSVGSDSQPDVILAYGKSADGVNFTWTELESAAAYTDFPDTGRRSTCLIQNPVSGRIGFAFMYDTGTGDYDIKLRYTDDLGSNWSSDIDVMDYTTADGFGGPLLYYDGATGYIYCYAANLDADDGVYYVKSTDDMETFNSGTAAVVVADGTDVLYPQDIIEYKSKVFLPYGNNTDTPDTFGLAFAKYYEVYDAGNNDIITLNLNGIHTLPGGLDISWRGYLGADGDIWTVQPDYLYAAGNIFDTIGPSKPWRSTSDSAAHEIIVQSSTTDATVNYPYITGIALFNCNWRAGDIMLNNTDSWGSPSVSESISFDEATGTVDSVAYAGWIQDTSLMASYEDGELKNKYVVFTSGSGSGETYKILDNKGTWIYIGPGSTANVAATDTFAVYNTSVFVPFTGGAYKYARIAMDSQATYEGYYQIGQAIMGYYTTLDRGWSVGSGHDSIQNLEVRRTTGGLHIPIRRNDDINRWTISYNYASTVVTQIISLANIVGEDFVAMVPGVNGNEAYLVRNLGDIKRVYQGGDKFTLSMGFEEVI